MPGNHNAILPMFSPMARTPETECWVWPNAIGTNGYGSLWIGSGRTARKSVAPHRYIWELINGPVPAGLELDHLCRNRACYRPEHLEAVTRSENVRRGDLWQRRVTHCPKGHAYDQENTRRDKRGYRNCRACDRLRRTENPAHEYLAVRE